MQNNILKLILLFFFITNILTLSNAEEQFKFRVTVIDITDNGNLITGSNGGTAITDDGYEIIAENFIYDKLTNILDASGNVRLVNTNDNSIIYSDKVTYLKNEEIIFTEGNSKAISEENIITASNFKFDKIKNILNAEKNVKFVDEKKDTQIYSDKVTYLKNEEIIFTEGNSKAISEENIITASNFKFDKIKNILNAEKNVKFVDEKKDTQIYSDKVTYLKNEEIILTKGNTSAFIENKYEFISKNVNYSKLNQNLKSENNSLIKDDNGNVYELERFIYQINEKILKGKNVNVMSKVDKNKTDNYFFSEGIFDFNKNSFVSKETKIKIHKEVFKNEEQDPRIYGVSSSGDENKTIINKGIFTSCKLNDNCPPWSIQSEKITHDKVKKDMIYENATLKIYDVPILYFPKFFHPDPTVKRRTGFLRPQFNNSNTLGSSIYVPYFITIGNDRDFTFKPTLFEDKVIFQNEYRKETKYSSLVTDFSLTKGYKSSVQNKKKNINHLFLNYQKDLNLPNFLESSLEANIERVNNDTYLKVFQNNLFDSPIMPKNKDVMVSKINFDFNHENYDFSTEFKVFENLGTKHSDRYQFVLPSYNFSKNLNIKNFDGSVNFYSSGSNYLKDTNNLRTSITNDIEFQSKDYFTINGFKNNFNLYFKNLNSLGKNDPTYKSSPRIEAMNIAEINTSFPLTKKSQTKYEIITPKISFRANPGNNMKDYSSSDKTIDASNIFEINRLGITDSFEAGRSLTLGIDYKIDKIEMEMKDLNSNIIKQKDKFLEFKLATVLRDKVETEIPTSSTIDKKNSNLFGSINNQLFENLELNYSFAVDNNFENFDSHSLSSKFKVNNFVTEFNYLEQSGEIGTSHFISNTTTYEVDENNKLSFSTRRNKKINLTEYYNLSYEYKNDCLTAGVKYNKTFYKDNDLKPQENLFFTITLIPLTTYERVIYEN